MFFQNDSQINQNQEKSICNDSLENSGTTSTNNSASLLEHSIRMMEVDVSSSDDESENTNYPEIIKAYSEIENQEKRIDINQDIVEYQGKQKYKLPYLSKLALIIHAVPATQVSVERAFSALKIMLDDLRCNLPLENLEKLMFVKLNFML